jgi:hypothetical protein
VTINAAIQETTTFQSSGIGLTINSFSMNGQGSSVTVPPGATVTMSVNFQVWSTQNPTEFDQVIQYYSWNPLPPTASTAFCLYNNVPGLYPGVTKTRSGLSFTAPTTSGTYYVYISKTVGYDCNQGMGQITSYGWNGYQVGTVTVQGSMRATTTTVTPSSLTVTHGTTFTFTATVTDTSPGTATPPTGTVTWTFSGTGATTSCTLVASGPNTSACSLTRQAPTRLGVYTVTATYSGDSTHNTSSGTSSLTVT